jgi:hypothetical protein
MLTAAKTILIRILSNPEVQTILFLVAVDLALKGRSRINLSVNKNIGSFSMSDRNKR